MTGLPEAIAELEKTAETIQKWAVSMARSLNTSESWTEVARVMAVRMGTTLEELKGQHRKRTHVYKRMVIAEALYRNGVKEVEIAKILKRDRSTVYSMIEQAENLRMYPDFSTIKEMIL